MWSSLRHSYASNIVSINPCRYFALNINRDFSSILHLYISLCIRTFCVFHLNDYFSFSSVLRARNCRRGTSWSAGALAGGRFSQPNGGQSASSPRCLVPWGNGGSVRSGMQLCPGPIPLSPPSTSSPTQRLVDAVWKNKSLNSSYSSIYYSPPQKYHVEAISKQQRHQDG